MAWSECPSADMFLTLRGPTLLAHESLNCLAWGALERAQSTGSTSKGARFLVFEEGGGASAHAMIGKGEGHLILSVMSAEQAHDLLDFLEAQGAELTLVEGPYGLAQDFAERWSELPTRRSERQMDQGLYELTQVRMPELQGGRLVLAGAAHRASLRALASGFVASFPDQVMTLELLDKRVERFIAQGRAYLWRRSDGAFVSMAAVVRQSPNTASISWVYTPPEHRRQGHAARVVATLSEAQLKEGKRACNLHTGLENKTSNAIYQRIGYRQIARSLRIRLIAS